MKNSTFLTLSVVLTLGLNLSAIADVDITDKCQEDARQDLRDGKNRFSLQAPDRQDSVCA